MLTLAVLGWNEEQQVYLLRASTLPLKMKEALRKQLEQTMKTHRPAHIHKEERCKVLSSACTVILLVHLISSHSIFVYMLCILYCFTSMYKCCCSNKKKSPCRICCYPSIYCSRYEGIRRNCSCSCQTELRQCISVSRYSCSAVGRTDSRVKQEEKKILLHTRWRSTSKRGTEAVSGRSEGIEIKDSLRQLNSGLTIMFLIDE